MVQLEPITAMRKMETIASFNSIMVQLEPPLQSVALPTSVFQFHYGSIRTPLTGRIIMRQFCFNSIKVQLEPQILDIPICGTFRFQFHKGSIRTVEHNHGQFSLQVSIP